MHEPLSVLIVDGDQPALRLVETVLAGEGFRIFGHNTGFGGLEAFEDSPTQVVLIDPALPDLDGFQVCQRIRSTTKGPDAVIIMLSATADAADRVRCFHSGSDGFLPKPIDLYELVLRIKAIRRRLGDGRSPSLHPPVRQVDPYMLDPATRTVIGPTGSVGLTPIEFQLLSYLMERPNTLIRSETLLQDVWRYHPGTGSPELVRFHIRSLRKKIESVPENPEYLVSAQGHGYMLRSSLQKTGT
jgi:DNA-binding response OmpR family regulator